MSFSDLPAEVSNRVSSYLSGKGTNSLARGDKKTHRALSESKPTMQRRGLYVSGPPDEHPHNENTLGLRYANVRQPWRPAFAFGGPPDNIDDVPEEWRPWYREQRALDWKHINVKAFDHRNPRHIEVFLPNGTKRVIDEVLPPRDEIYGTAIRKKGPKPVVRTRQLFEFIDSWMDAEENRERVRLGLDSHIQREYINGQRMVREDVDGEAQARPWRKAEPLLLNIRVGSHSNRRDVDAKYGMDRRVLWESGDLEIPFPSTVWVTQYDALRDKETIASMLPHWLYRPKEGERPGGPRYRALLPDYRAGYPVPGSRDSRSDASAAAAAGTAAAAAAWPEPSFGSDTHFQRRGGAGSDAREHSGSGHGGGRQNTSWMQLVRSVHARRTARDSRATYKDSLLHASKRTIRIANVAQSSKAHRDGEMTEPSLTLARAKHQVRESVAQYEALRIEFLPNDKPVDVALLRALDTATTWPQVGIITYTLPQRMALLQRAIQPLGPSYTATIPMQFNTARFGWYWVYGVNPAGTSGFLACVFRFPTSMLGGPSDAVFCLCGYVVADSHTRPFGTLNAPIMCPGSQTVRADGSLALVLDLSPYRHDDAVYLNAFSLDGDAATFKTIRTTITYKTAPAVHTYVLISARDAVYEGKHGCSPVCVAGAGTDYWSMTYMTGPAGLVGWFDHQWLNSVPHDAGTRMFADALSVGKPMLRTAWVFVTLQLTPNLQYTVTYSGFKTSAAIMRVGVGSVLPSIANKFASGKPEYNLPAVITVLSAMTEDSRLPNALAIEVDGRRVVVTAICDGRIVPPDASVNLEALALVCDASGPIGVGCIEITGFHDEEADVSHMLSVANIQGPIDDFMIHGSTQKTDKQALTFLILLVVGVLVVTAAIACGIYVTTAKKKK